MSEQKYDIIFRGDIVLGHQLPEVKQKLAQLFKADAAKIDALFTGAAVPLKRNLDAATAKKYQAVLTKAGAQVDIKAAGATKVAPPRPAAKVVQKQEPEPVSSPSVPAAAPPAEPAIPTAEVSADFGLAPAGADLLSASERHQVETVEVDISALDVAPVGELLAEDERAQSVEVEFDFGNIDVAEAGSDLLNADEHHEPEPVVVDISGLDIEEAGGELLHADEKKEQPVLDLDLSSLDIAPAGSDLGQKEKEAPPPPPDTSGLSLS